MVELKTLKDIETLDMKEKAFANLIKKEAIEWVKHFNKYSYPFEADKEFMNFFNITEGDLK